MPVSSLDLKRQMLLQRDIESKEAVSTVQKPLPKKRSITKKDIEEIKKTKLEEPKSFFQAILDNLNNLLTGMLANISATVILMVIAIMIAYIFISRI